MNNNDIVIEGVILNEDDVQVLELSKESITVDALTQAALVSMTHGRLASAMLKLELAGMLKRDGLSVLANWKTMAELEKVAAAPTVKPEAYCIRGVWAAAASKVVTREKSRYELDYARIEQLPGMQVRVDATDGRVALRLTLEDEHTAPDDDLPAPVYVKADALEWLSSTQAKRAAAAVVRTDGHLVAFCKGNLTAEMPGAVKHDATFVPAHALDQIMAKAQEGPPTVGVQLCHLVTLCEAMMAAGVVCAEVRTHGADQPLGFHAQVGACSVDAMLMPVRLAKPAPVEVEKGTEVAA